MGKITTEGHRHIGAALGSQSFKEEYVKMKVECWVKDINNLAEIAQEEPQAALSAFNIGLSKRWTFLQRTDHDISKLFQPLENAIWDSLICGREVTEDQRRMLSLPYRYGGVRNEKPSENS